MAGKKLLAERISHERELRIAEKSAFDHERELRMIFDQHERELRLQAENAVEKARSRQFDVYEQRLLNLNHAAERMEQQSKTFLPTDRYEREHQALVQKHTDDIARVSEDIEQEHKVTTKQDAQRELLDRLSSNNRWLIGLAIGSVLSLAALMAHLFGLY